MGLPILNFKFLPDRCHWGRNSSCVRGRRGAAGAATAPHCGQQQPHILSGVGPALYSLQSSLPTAARGLGRDAHCPVTRGWWLRVAEAVTDHVSGRAGLRSQA